IRELVMTERNEGEHIEQQEQQPDETIAQASADPQATDTSVSADVTELQAQLQAARDEVAQYKDKWLRERAEMENFRKRQERLANERNQRYKRDLLEKVLEVVDNLDRAMSYTDTMDRDGLQNSLRMVHWQLNELIKTEGLTPVASVGQEFDPRVHEAIESVASSEHPEGQVVEEVRKGYMIGNEMLRPARVKVSAG
ncbi:MAG: nucleotide exchange factor GrpE, partial [Ktedonobacterales bacterium]